MCEAHPNPRYAQRATGTPHHPAARGGSWSRTGSKMAHSSHRQHEGCRCCKPHRTVGTVAQWSNPGRSFARSGRKGVSSAETWMTPDEGIRSKRAAAPRRHRHPTVGQTTGRWSSPPPFAPRSAHE